MRKRTSSGNSTPRVKVEDFSDQWKKATEAEMMRVLFDIEKRMPEIGIADALIIFYKIDPRTLDDKIVYPASLHQLMESAGKAR